jgi:hypothetical protein
VPSRGSRDVKVYSDKACSMNFLVNASFRSVVALDIACLFPVSIDHQSEPENELNHAIEQGF